MSDEQQRPDVRRLWQSQVEESTPFSLDDLRNKVSKMNKLILFRAFVAGLAFLVFIGFFGQIALTWRPSTLVTAADIEISQCVFLIGAGYSVWWLISLLRRARGKSLTEGEPNACAAFYRSELKRQWKLHRRSAVWVPLALSAVWIWVLLATQQFRVLTIFGVLMMVIWLLFVPFWVYHGLETARTSQRELDKLNASFR
jgi:hypothetical protein